MLQGVATGSWCVASLCPFARGAPRRPTDSQNWGGRRPGWHARDLDLNFTIDVLHCNDSTDLVWMYELNSSAAANHTSLRQHQYTYYLGRTLVMSDTADLHHMFNHSLCLTCTPPRFVMGKYDLMRVAQRALNAEYRSLVFEHHIDGGACRNRRLREIVHLGSRTLNHTRVLGPEAPGAFTARAQPGQLPGPIHGL